MLIKDFDKIEKKGFFLFLVSYNIINFFEFKYMGFFF